MAWEQSRAMISRWQQLYRRHKPAAAAAQLIIGCVLLLGAISYIRRPPAIPTIDVERESSWMHWKFAAKSKPLSPLAWQRLPKLEICKS